MESLKDIFNNQKKTNAILLALGAFIGYKALKGVKASIKKKQIQKNFKENIQYYLKEREERFKEINIPELTISTNFQEQILNAPISEIKSYLEEGKLTSEELLNLYAKRAYTIGKDLNLITESNYTEALRMAKYYDQLRKSNPEQCKGELFGIVISVKDTFDVKGLPSTIGCASRIDYYPEEDGLVVKVLRQSGAIIFVKTNVPQVAMMIESINNVYGISQNPWNKDRTVGGSSGGESGLIASRCSPLGIGSDIGGSVRNPAAMTGLVGMKPTAERVNFKGHTFFIDGFNGQQAVKCTLGTMSKYVEDSIYMMKALINDEYYNKVKNSQKNMYHINKPWDNEEYTTQRKLKIGYFKSLPLFIPPTCVQRAVQESVNVLEQQCHEIQEITLPFYEEVRDLHFKLLGSDGWDCIIDILKGEEPVPFNKGLHEVYKTSKWKRNIQAKILSMKGEHRISHGIKIADRTSASEYRQNIYQLQALREKFIEYMEQNGLDAILCPAHGLPAGTHNYSNDLILSLVYCFLWNSLNVPAGVVPVSVVKEDEQNYDLDDNHNDYLTLKTKEQMKGTIGLPLNVQVVTPPLQEELCMNIMKQIEKLVNFHKKYPYPI